MAQASSAPPVRTPTADSADTVLATVRLEVRSGGGRATVYEIGDGGFLIGSVPGCDLRLPGSNLPPIICLLARNAAGASLRRLAPVLPILVNGKAVASAYLNNGDRVTIGPVEIGLTITPGKSPTTAGEGISPSLEERERQLKEQLEQLETDRVIWYRRREEIDAECRRQAEELQQVVQRLQRQEQELAGARAELEQRERTWKAEQEELIRQREEAEALGQEGKKYHEEASAVRRELTEIRQQLYQRYHDRR